MLTLAWSFPLLVSIEVIKQRLIRHYHHQLKCYRVQAERRRNLKIRHRYVKHLRNRRTYPNLSQNQMKVRANRYQPTQKATHDQILIFLCLSQFIKINVNFDQRKFEKKNKTKQKKKKHQFFICWIGVNYQLHKAMMSIASLSWHFSDEIVFPILVFCR